MALSVVFMGTPDFAVPTLIEIIGHGHDVVAVYTQPPRPAGRGMAERLSPVHARAQSFGIAVRTPATLRDPHVQAEFMAQGADVAVVVAYGLILPPPILQAPAQGCLNLHASLLPRWRGAAPIQRAMMAGDVETGVMVMRMAEGLDTGPVCMAERVAIALSDTAGALTDRLAGLGADLMVRALGAVERGALQCTPQSEVGATYAAKIDKGETRIDWSGDACSTLNHIHGLSPFPGAWCEIREGDAVERLKVLRAALAEGSGHSGTILSVDPLIVACGRGALRLVELQRAGRKAGPAEAVLRGVRLAKGSRLG